MTRVLHFAGNYLPVPGGTSTRLHHLLADPAQRHRLIVPWPGAQACPDDVGEVPLREECGGLEVRRVPVGERGGRGWLGWSANRRLQRGMLAAAAGFEADVLHAHNPWACVRAALTWRRRHAVPMVYEAHGIMHDHANLPRIFGRLGPLNSAAQATMRRVIAADERRVLMAADRVIAQTEAAARRLRELYDLRDTPVDVIRNGVDAGHFDPQRWAEDGAALRRQRGWDERVVVFYAGYLDRVNGVQFMLDALPQLAAAGGGQLRLVLAGRGPLQAAVQASAARHPEVLEYVGMVALADMPRCYAASDVFVIPRPAYAPGELFLPVKLLEAMAMGRLVVVSDVAAMTEVVRDGVNGLVFAKGDAGAFVEVMQRVVSERAALSALGERARQDVLRECTWERARGQLAEVYRVLSERRAAAGAGRH